MLKLIMPFHCFIPRLITVQDNTMLKLRVLQYFRHLRLITVQDNTMLKPIF